MLVHSVKLLIVNAAKCLTILLFKERGIPPSVRFLFENVKISRLHEVHMDCTYVYMFLMLVPLDVLILASDSDSFFLLLYKATRDLIYFRGWEF